MSDDAPVRWITGDDEVALLAARVVDPGRAGPLVCLTTQPYLQRPMLDPDAIHSALEGRAEVWVITRTPHAWLLTESLPPGLDVYGGAARVWWPIQDAAQADPHDHPVFTIFSPDDAERVARDIVTHVERRLHPPPEAGTDTVGVVTAVLQHGAEIMLASGFPAFATNGHLATAPIYHAGEAVREGQRVRVRVSGPPPPGRATIPVSLRPFAPDPWDRLADVYEPGMVVEGIVVELRNFGAFVELLPGAKGLVPKSLISREYVGHPEDFVREDDRVLVRLVSMDIAERRATVSLIDVPEDAEVEPLPSLYPDGPPWLPPHDDAPPTPALEPTPEQAAPERPEAGAEPSRQDEVPEAVPPDPVAAPPPDAVETPPPDTVEVPPPDLIEVPPPDLIEAPDTVEVPGTAAEAEDDDPAGAPAPGIELQALAEAVAAGAAVQEGLASATETAGRELARLRSEARRLTADLREEIAAAELRILRLGQEGTGELLGATQQEVGELRRAASDLRERLTAAERDREELIRRARAAGERAEMRARQADAARDQAARAQAEAANLREQLDSVDGGDPARRFVRELHHTWSRLYASADDQRRYPFTEPLLGPAFMESLDRTQGVTRERVLEVCAHVVAGRAPEINSLELHQLRTGEGGEAAIRVREDGATAWRVSLQVKTPSARRLHYWQLLDGRVELSKIGVHDDVSIV